MYGRKIQRLKQQKENTMSFETETKELALRFQTSTLDKAFRSKEQVESHMKGLRGEANAFMGSIAKSRRDWVYTELRQCLATAQGIAEQSLEGWQETEKRKNEKALRPIGLVRNETDLDLIRNLDGAATACARMLGQSELAVCWADECPGSVQTVGESELSFALYRAVRLHVEANDRTVSEMEEVLKYLLVRIQQGGCVIANDVAIWLRCAALADAVRDMHYEVYERERA
jgi:hypothetical protein